MKTLSYNNLELSFTDRGRLCCLSQNGDRITGNRQDDPYVTLCDRRKGILRRARPCLCALAGGKRRARRYLYGRRL